MIQTFQNFASSIWHLCQSVGEFLKSLIDGLITIFKLLPEVINLTSGSFGNLPSTLVVFATLTLTITIIYLIVGRNTGGSDE